MLSREHIEKLILLKSDSILISEPVPLSASFRHEETEITTVIALPNINNPLNAIALAFF